MEIKNYICECAEGFIIPVGEYCPICQCRDSSIRGKRMGYWAEPKRDAEFFVLKHAGWKTIEIAERFGVSVDTVRRANKKFPDRALNF